MSTVTTGTTKYAFCPGWCATTHDDDFGQDTETGLPVIAHVSREGTAAAATSERHYAWVAREDFVVAGEGVRYGAAKIEVSGDVETWDGTADEARALGGQLILLAEILETGVGDTV